MTKALELAKFGRESAPAGLVVGDNDAQTLSSKTFSDGPVFSGLNANAIPYLNASKVLSSSSTFVFDGTNIGLGIASPAATLHVNASGGGTIRASRSSVGGEYVQLDHDGTDGTLRVSGNNKLYLTTNGSTRVTVNGSGDVGIGTAPSSNAKLQVTGYTDFWNSTNTLLRVQHDGTRGRLQAYTGGAVGNIGINSEGGSVGIGTDSPGAKLDVSGSLRSQGFTGTSSNISGGANQVTLDYLAASGGARLLGWGPDTTTRGGIALTVVSSDASLYTDAIRITNAARVGIGLASPISYLHVNTGGTTRGLTVDNNYTGGNGGTSGASAANATNDLITLRAAYGDNAETTTNAGMKWGIHFTGYTGDTFGFNGKSAAIYAVSEETENAGYNRKVGLSFWTSSFDANYAERFRIDNNGRVIINPNQTTTYAGMLDIYGGGSGALGAIRIGDGTYSGGHVNYWDIGRDNTVSGDFTFALNASEKVRIQTNGNVAIGDTTASGYKLKVAGTANVTGALVVGSYASVGSIVANDPGAGYYSYNNRIGGSLAVVGTLYNAGNLFANRFTLNQGSTGPTRTAGTVAAGWYRFARSADSGAGGFGARGGCTFYMYTTGGWSGPGQTKIDLFKDYSTNGNLTVDTKGNYYFSNWRIAMDSNYAYLEGWTNGFSFGGDNTFNTIVDSDGWDSGGWTIVTGKQIGRAHV